MKIHHAAPFLVIGVVACGAPEANETKSASAQAAAAPWSCASTEVPMGEVVRCTQGALGTDSTSYDCTVGDSECPPDDGSTDAPPPSEPPSEPPPDETETTEKTPPGQAKKQGPETPPPSSSDSSEPPAKKKFKCKKDHAGNKSCDSSPSCSPGTHAAECGACVPDGETSDCVPPEEGGCWITGGGFVDDGGGNDNFGGNAKPMKDGSVQGHWNHVDHAGQHSNGTPRYIVCRHVDEPGPGQPGGKKGLTSNQVYFGGPAKWRSNDVWSDGYWFDVVAKDHGEPGSVPKAKNGNMPDTYHFTIRKLEDPVALVSGPIVYETKGSLEGGNIQIHPPNPGHPGAEMSLPPWVQFEP
jgi:hypothetical protein